MKEFLIGVVLLAGLGAACAKAGSDDGPRPNGSESQFKAASKAAADSYVGSLEQSAGSVVGIGAAQQKAALAAAGESYVSSLGDLRPGPLSVGATALAGSAESYVASAAPIVATVITSPETITTVGTEVKAKWIDVGRQGLSVGDTYVTTSDILGQAGVTQMADLGTERTQCTLGPDRWAICTGTFDITGRGEIVATGMVNFGTENPDFDVPITGGTGEFANVRGVAHVHLTKNGETDTLELLP